MTCCYCCYHRQPLLLLTPPARLNTPFITHSEKEDAPSWLYLIRAPWQDRLNTNFFFLLENSVLPARESCSKTSSVCASMSVYVTVISLYHLFFYHLYHLCLPIYRSVSVMHLRFLCVNLSNLYLSLYIAVSPLLL